MGASVRRASVCGGLLRARCCQEREGREKDGAVEPRVDFWETFSIAFDASIGPAFVGSSAAEDHLLSKARLDLVGHRVSAGAAKCPRIPAPVDATLPVKAAV
jgi:hypothetical protein